VKIPERLTLTKVPEHAGGGVVDNRRSRDTYSTFGFTPPRSARSAEFERSGHESKFIGLWSLDGTEVISKVLKYLHRAGREEGIK